jgi:hypothetical protein
MTSIYRPPYRSKTDISRLRFDQTVNLYSYYFFDVFEVNFLIDQVETRPNIIGPIAYNKKIIWMILFYLFNSIV